MKPPYYITGATISPCGLFRYSLTREWDSALPTLGLIMLNPSTADAERGDPTVYASLDMAERWGFGKLIIGNLFAWRSSSTAALQKAVDARVAVGIDNDGWLRHIINSCDQVAVGWGSWGRKYIERVRQVDHLIRHMNKAPKCIGVTENGHPKHFLLRFHTAAQKRDAELRPWVCP